MHAGIELMWLKDQSVVTLDPIKLFCHVIHIRLFVVSMEIRVMPSDNMMRENGI